MRIKGQSRWSNLWVENNDVVQFCQSIVASMSCKDVRHIRSIVFSVSLISFYSLVWFCSNLPCSQPWKAICRRHFLALSWQAAGTYTYPVVSMLPVFGTPFKNSAWSNINSCRICTLIRKKLETCIHSLPWRLRRWCFEYRHKCAGGCDRQWGSHSCW